MNPTIRATIEVGASAFAVGFLTYLAPLLQGSSLPDKSAWGSILVNALVAGGLAAYHRLMPNPAATKAALAVKP